MREGYKQTAVGVIPEDWEVKELGDLAEIGTGNTPPTTNAANYGNEYLFVGPADISSNKYISNTEKYLSKRGFSIARRFPKDSVLFVCIGSTIGKCAIASVELSANQQINVLSPLSNCNNEFLFYALSLISPKIRLQAGEQAVPIINKSQFSKTAISLPPLPEQRAIVSALADVDALLASLEALLTKKRQLKQAAMQELLTGKTRLGGFTGAWEEKRLGNFAPLQRGFDLPNRDIVEGLVPIVYSNGIEKYHAKSIAKGPGVVTGRSGTIGKVFYVEGGYWPHNTSLWVTSFNGNYPKFVFYVYKYLGFSRFSSGTGVPTLNRNDAHSFPLLVPPPAEQKAIASILSEIDAELEALAGRVTKTRHLKQGMMQELLTGRTRLV